MLQAIQDVQWVVGSFVGSAEGELLLYQMPEEFGEEQLLRTTNRLANIIRCAEYCDLNVDQCNLSLSRYQLVMKSFVGGLLCVMVEAPVSKRALNMAMRLALEYLPDTVEDLLHDWEGDAFGASANVGSELPPGVGKIGDDEPTVEVHSVDPGGVDPGGVDPGGVDPGGVDPGIMGPGSTGRGRVEARRGNKLGSAVEHSEGLPPFASPPSVVLKAEQ